jgi:hypothetical protein
MVPPLRVTGEAVARLLEEFGCHLQVALSGPEIDVAEVGCQLRQEPLDVPPRAIPRHHPVHGGSVAQIVQAWRTTLAGRAAYARRPSDVLKQPDDMLVGPALARAGGE